MNAYKTTHDDYMTFFEKWLHYQFPRVEDDWNNYSILRIVAKIVSDDDELQHWANRDCWTMYYLAEKSLVSEVSA